MSGIVLPPSGTVTAGGLQSVDQVLDASVPEVMAAGGYRATLVLGSDDPETPRLEAPMTMMVQSRPPRLFLPLVLRSAPLRTWLSTCLQLVAGRSQYDWPIPNCRAIASFLGRLKPPVNH